MTFRCEFVKQCNRSEMMLEEGKRCMESEEEKNGSHWCWW